MSSVPIPQGATIEQAPAPAATAVPIPQNAIVEPQPGKGVTTDSMDADYQFKNPSLTPDETKELQTANDSRSIFRKVLGLAPNDQRGADLNARDTAHQTESAQHSSYVQQQITDKAAGGAVVASAPVAAGSAYAASSVPALAATARTIATVGPPAAKAAGTIIRIAKSPITRELIGSAKDLGIVAKLLGLF